MPSPERRWAALLRSQGLGLLCGFSTVVLLATGSFVMAATRDGASAGIAMDDVRGFFARPSWVHLWFYLLVPVLGLYLLNTALATWHSVALKLRAGVTSPARYAPAVIHTAFLLALVAHGASGLLGEERGEAVIAQGAWQALPGGREARLLSLEVDRLPGGMPKEVRAAVELRGEGGPSQRAVVGYNRPISGSLGAELHLLSDMGQAQVAEISMGSERCQAVPGSGCRLGGLEVELLGLAGRGPGTVAQVRVDRPGAPGQGLWLWEGRETPVADGRPLRLDSVSTRPAILVRSRAAPGNPWAFFAALTIGLGIALLWRRFLPRATAPAGEAE
jgi:hypothetical protein